jgi:hypothetical protein
MNISYNYNYKVAEQFKQLFGNGECGKSLVTRFVKSEMTMEQAELVADLLIVFTNYCEHVEERLN